MKKARHIILAFVLLAFSQAIYAQDYDLYLQKARQRLAEGDCSRAETSYNTYKTLTNKIDMEIERQILQCKSGGKGDKVEFQLDEGSYFGEVANGKPLGKGIIYYISDDSFDEVSYEGNWKDDNKYGQGTY